MTWVRSAALVYLCAGMFSLGFMLSQARMKGMLLEVRPTEVVIVVALWPVVWGMAVSEGRA